MNNINRKLLFKSIMEGASMSALVVGVACLFALVIVSMISWLIGHPWIIYCGIAFAVFVVLSVRWSREFYIDAKKGGTHEKNPFKEID